MLVNMLLDIGKSRAMMDSGDVSQTAEYSFLHNYNDLFFAIYSKKTENKSYLYSR